MPVALDIEVSQAPIPDQAVWIDSPGINDTVAMSERALNVALGADILIWVLNSRQCLSEPEIRFLASYVEKHGPDALYFVLNAFLDEDSKTAWKRFCERELPILVGRIRDHAEEFGMDGDNISVRPISARATLETRSDSFGAAGLRRWLSTLDSTDAPAVRKSRLRRCEVACLAYAAALEPAIKAAVGDLDVREKAMACYDDVIKRRREFASLSKTTIKTVLENFERNALAAANKITDAIEAGSLRTPKTYEAQISDALQNLGTCRELCDRLATLAGKLGLASPRKELEADISCRLAVRPLSVTVYDTPLETGTVAGGAILGGVLSLLTLGAATPFVVAGGAAGYMAAKSQKADTDATLTKTSVRDAASKEAKRIRSLAGELADLVEAKWLGPAPPKPQLPDKSTLSSLRALRDAYRAFPSRLSINE